MNNKDSSIIRCIDCDYLVCWRNGEVAEKYGPGYECHINVILCPDPNDFCSKAKPIKKCNNCGRRFDEYPNFCPDCGEKLL